MLKLRGSPWVHGRLNAAPIDLKTHIQYD
jgi:hypothetical protein